MRATSLLTVMLALAPTPAPAAAGAQAARAVPVGARVRFTPQEGTRSLVGIVGGAGGSLIGLAVGASVRTERWEAMPGDGAGAANGPRSAGRLTLGLSLRF